MNSEDIIKVLNDTVEGLKQDIEKANKVVVKEVLEKIVSDTDEYVPYKSGGISRSVYIDSDYSGFGYSADYAEYAFEPWTKNGKNKVYNKDVHSKAGGYPFDRAYLDNNKDWTELYKKLLLKELGKK